VLGFTVNLNNPLPSVLKSPTAMTAGLVPAGKLVGVKKVIIARASSISSDGRRDPYRFRLAGFCPLLERLEDLRDLPRNRNADMERTLLNRG
jgi:hypothetical protein